MNQISRIKSQGLGILMAVIFLITAGNVSAHVVVKPSEVGIGQRLNFAVSVPTEKDNPTVGIRLMIPAGLKSVRPNVKPGWNIQLRKSGEGNEAVITEISWSGGNIPIEQRDEFVFNAQAPAEESTLIWKAYQTYADGDVVAWENDSKTVEEYARNNPVKEGEDDHSALRPYSETKVINDLKVSAKPEVNSIVKAEDGQNLPFVLSAAAVIVSGFALGIAFRKK